MIATERTQVYRSDYMTTWESGVNKYPLQSSKLMSVTVIAVFPRPVQQAHEK